MNHLMLRYSTTLNGFEANFQPCSMTSKPEFGCVRLAVNVFIGDLSPYVDSTSKVSSFVKVNIRPIGEVLSKVPFGVWRNGAFSRIETSFIKANYFAIPYKTTPHPFPNIAGWRATAIRNCHLNLEMIYNANPLHAWIRDTEICAQFFFGGVPAFFDKFIGSAPQFPCVDHQSTSELNKENGDDSKNGGKNNEQFLVARANPLPRNSESVSESEKNRAAKSGAFVLIGLSVCLVAAYFIVYAPIEKRNKNEADKSDE